MSSIKRIAIVLFGGSGTRFGAPIPKQFVTMGNKPMMVWTLEGLCACEEIENILVVAKEGTIEKTKAVIREHGISKIIDVIPGGETREESVWNALSALKTNGTHDDDLVLIQDGDRPYINKDIIAANFIAAEEIGGAVTAIPSTDSVLVCDGEEEVSSYLPRATLYRAQTPQTFRFGVAYSSFLSIKRINPLSSFTDDASIVKQNGNRVRIIAGDLRNIKITTPEDLNLFLEGRDAP